MERQPHVGAAWNESSDSSSSDSDSSCDDSSDEDDPSTRLGESPPLPVGRQVLL